MRIFASFVSWIMVVFLFTGCKKKSEDPSAPVLVYKSISDATVEQFNNSIQIVFSYEDYQGDLGETDPDNYTLRVKDARLSDWDWYHIPPMTPDMKELHIKGQYVLQLEPVFLLGSGTQEYTRFSVEMRDRAGNWSNTITTPNVLIVDSL